MNPGIVPEYASTRLIAYLGNKRALLPRLAALFRELEAERGVFRFLDPFAGSGSVARLAASFGWRVMASDLEEYSYWLNLAWVGCSAEEGAALWGDEGGLAAVLGRLNRLHPEREGDDFPHEPYLSRHYAPASTARADFRSERLFYTRENAVFLDRARSALEGLRPERPPSGAARRPSGTSPVAGEELSRLKEKALVLGPLLLQAATHANTSGVFKACHKGFGGHGKDALKRIMAPMLLEPPLLWPAHPGAPERGAAPGRGHAGAEIGLGDAAAFCRGRPAELCYLDPPYNQHQYASNYHLLDTIARWDRAPVSDERDPEGVLLRKAGIPDSWKDRRSAYCSRKTAAEAFRELLASIDAGVIVLSYNDEGLVPREELWELLAERAEVSIRSDSYVKYRGGRQSAERLTRNHELLFIARRRPERASARADREAKDPGRPLPEAGSPDLSRAELELRLARAMAGPLAPSRIVATVPEDPAVRESPGSAEGGASAGGASAGPARRGRLLRSGGDLLFRASCQVLRIGPWNSFSHGAAPEALRLPDGELKALAEALEPLRAADNAEAARETLRMLRGELPPDLARAGLERRLLALLRKLAHPRYRNEFTRLFRESEELAQPAMEGGSILGRELERLAGQAGLRMGWTREG